MRKKAYYYDTTNSCIDTQVFEADTMEEIEALSLVYADTIPEDLDVAGINYREVRNESH